tara:strand:+ start:405 stop:674 length:270 start_codon:yes stop_codon:yes gene_type:complete
MISHDPDWSVAVRPAGSPVLMLGRFFPGGRVRLNPGKRAAVGAMSEEERSTEKRDESGIFHEIGLLKNLGKKRESKADPCQGDCVSASR